MSVIVNAVITSARIEMDDHGILSAWLMLDYGGSGQGFGGYVLYSPVDFKKLRKTWNYAGHFIWRCLEVVGVEEWRQLEGKSIRVRKEDEWGKIEAIGHIVENDWFDPHKDFSLVKPNG